MSDVSEILRQWRDEKEWTYGELININGRMLWDVSSGRIAICRLNDFDARDVCNRHNATLARQRLLAELLSETLELVDNYYQLCSEVDLHNTANTVFIQRLKIERRLTDAAKGETP